MASSKYDVTAAATSYAGPKFDRNLKSQCVNQNENRIIEQVLHDVWQKSNAIGNAVHEPTMLLPPPSHGS
jgi:hypothetical protein